MSNPLFPLVDTAATKGRGGGGGSINGIDDGWDAPPAQKALLAFQILFGIACLVLLLGIFKNLGRIPGTWAKGPYILLAVTVVFAILDYIVLSVYTRLQGGGQELFYTLNGLMDLFATVQNLFLPAVALSLIHKRAAVLQALKGNTSVPLASQMWKRIFDWALVGLNCVLYIAFAGSYGTLCAGYINDTISDSQARQINRSLIGLKHARVTFGLLLCINVVVSLIVQSIQMKRAQWSDPVIRRLLISIPFFVVLWIEILALDIYVTASLAYSRLGLAFAQTIIEALCRLPIIGIFILTMTLPNVQWSPQQTGAPEAYNGATMQQQIPPNVAWQQPIPIQQQQQQTHQYQPYYQPQQPAYQQPQQQ